MTEAEKFKVWLQTVYISDKTNGPLQSGTQYVTGLNALNRQLNLTGDGIFDPNADLKLIRSLIDKPENFQKDYSSHFNAYLKFRQFEIENKKHHSKKPLFRQPDIFKKQQVESSAINAAIAHFEKLQYIVISKEQDNVGWDLEASNLDNTLLLEMARFPIKVLCFSFRHIIYCLGMILLV